MRKAAGSTTQDKIQRAFVDFLYPMYTCAVTHRNTLVVCVRELVKDSALLTVLLWMLLMTGTTGGSSGKFSCTTSFVATSSLRS